MHHERFFYYDYIDHKLLENNFLLYQNHVEHKPLDSSYNRVMQNVVVHQSWSHGEFSHSVLLWPVFWSENLWENRILAHSTSWQNNLQNWCIAMIITVNRVQKEKTFGHCIVEQCWHPATSLFPLFFKSFLVGIFFPLFCKGKNINHWVSFFRE